MTVCRRQGDASPIFNASDSLIPKPSGLEIFNAVILSLILRMVRPTAMACFVTMWNTFSGTALFCASAVAA
eukprot:6030234-Amphidinium_carterae.1